VIGKGEDQSRAPAQAPLISSGFVRGKAEKLMLVANGTNGAVETTAYAGTSPAVELRDSLASLDWQAAGTATATTAAAKPRDTLADKRAEARMKGYVGEACPECANFTLVRNGTCLKCDTCGSTTGCS